MRFGRWTFSILLVVCLGLAAVPDGSPWMDGERPRRRSVS